MIATFEGIAIDLMRKPDTTYRSYLLRLWRGDEPDFEWHAMLESVTMPSKRHYFKDLESLSVYLLNLKDDEPFKVKGAGN